MTTQLSFKHNNDPMILVFCIDESIDESIDERYLRCDNRYEPTIFNISVIPMKFSDPVYITRPFVAPLDTYTKLLDSVWTSQWFTNNGPLVRQLEADLCKRLQLSNTLLVNNGTIALHVALKALDLPKGAILTTPFTWIATASSIVWEGHTPKFVDVDPHTFNIDVTKIEDSITSDTVAIVAVHVFSNPCDVEALETISKKYNLPILYDAAHAFGVRTGNRSIFEWGTSPPCLFMQPRYSIQQREVESFATQRTSRNGCDLMNKSAILGI